MHRPIYPALLALTLTLAVLNSPTTLAEKGGKGGGDHGKGASVEHRSEGKAEGRGNKVEFKNQVRQGVHGQFGADDDRDRNSAGVRDERKDDRKEAIREFKDDMKEAKDKPREVRNALREEARDEKKDAFKEAKRDFSNRDNDNDFDGDRLNLGKDFRRAVFVRGVPDNDSDFVLIRVTPENERGLADLFRENHRDRTLFDRFFAPRLDIGSVIDERDMDNVHLLPISQNAQFGLPTDDTFRVAIIDDQLVLLDMDRMLVMDTLRFDNEGRLITTDVQIPNDRLLFYRLDDTDDAALRAYVITHPELFNRELSLGERIRRNALLPLGIGDVVIGRTLPVLADPVFFSPPVLADLDLPGTGLKIALVGNDLALIDPDTNLVLDVVRDVV